jgi:hypothetical protein
MTVVAERDRIADIPTIGDDDLCHVVTPGSVAAACGAPAHASCVGTGYTGQDTCPECERRICPECAAIVNCAKPQGGGAR